MSTETELNQSYSVSQGGAQAPAPDRRPGILVQGTLADHLWDRFTEHSLNPIFVLEGRPSLTAAKTASRMLTALGITPTILSDNMAGYLFAQGLVKEVWLAGRVCDKQGVMGEVGALLIAILAQHHHVPVKAFIHKQKGKVMGKPKDLQLFDGQVVLGGRIQAFVPLVEWVPAKYLKEIVYE